MGAAPTFNVVAASLATQLRRKRRRCWWEAKLHMTMSSSSLRKCRAEACGAEVDRDRHVGPCQPCRNSSPASGGCNGQNLDGDSVRQRALPQQQSLRRLQRTKALTEEVCADVEAVTLVPREQVQQWTSEQSEDIPQLPEAHRERVEQSASISRRSRRGGDVSPA